MKYFLMFLFAVTLIGCAKAETHESEISDLESRVEALQSQQATADETMMQLLARIDFEATLVDELQIRLDTLLVSNQSTAFQLIDLEDMIADVQKQLNSDADKIKNHGRVKGKNK